MLQLYIPCVQDTWPTMDWKAAFDFDGLDDDDYADLPSSDDGTEEGQHNERFPTLGKTVF